jgi:hypothetical protein
MTSYATVDGVRMLVLPAQHPATLARRGKAAEPVNPETTIQQVYAPCFTHVVNIRQSEIAHLPPASMNVTRLVLCSKYDPTVGEASCKMGARCKFVHADTRAARRHEIHVNYAWRDASEVTYERFAAGQLFEVVAPNGKSIGDVMDSHMALKTKAVATKRRPLTHCAHYYFNRTCNLGADCQFVHAVFIDPTAKDHARAPLPAQLGRNHQQNPGTGIRARAAAAAASGAASTRSSVAPYGSQPHHHHHQHAYQSHRAAPFAGSDDAFAATLPAQTSPGGGSFHSAASGRSTPLDAMHGEVASDGGSGTHTPTGSARGPAATLVMSASTASTGSGDTAVTGRASRVRHDPYSFSGMMV